VSSVFIVSIQMIEHRKKRYNTIEIHRGRFHMRIAVLASNFYRKRVLSEREWVKVGWMMSIDEESVLSVQLVPSFLPSFLCFLFYFYLIILIFLFLSITFVSFSITYCLFFSASLSLYFKAHRVYILTTLTSSLLFIVYVCEQQVREDRERERKKAWKLYTIITTTKTFMYE
jgi:hypothetical protein